MSEHDEQAALFQWAALNEGDYPELELLHAIPNGGKRSKLTAIKLKAEGVKAGVADVFLPVSRGGMHGLYIEMKYGRNRLTQEQARFLSAVTLQGYLTAVCYNWQEAAAVITGYLESSSFRLGVPRSPMREIIEK